MSQKQTKSTRRLLTPNQIVALNLTDLRRWRGWTQEEFAKRLEPFIGERWSVAVVSAAERSIDGKRVREFTADELVAIARTFGVPVGKLFLIPNLAPGQRQVEGLKVPDRVDGLPHDEVLVLALGDDANAIEEAARTLAADMLREATQQLDKPFTKVKKAGKAFVDTTLRTTEGKTRA